MMREVLIRNPVARKDLRTLLRGSGASTLLCSYIAIMAAPVLIFLLRQSSTSDQSVSGAALFSALAAVQLFLILSLTPISVALALQTEQAQETWDLLIMTRLSAFQIVWGKFFTGFVFQLLLAVSALPLYGVALVYGGVASGELLGTLAVLCFTVLLSAALGFVTHQRSDFSYIPIVMGTALLVTFTVLSSFFILLLGDGTHISIGPLTFTPQFSRLAPLNPLAALASALPHAGAPWLLTDLQKITHPFGFQIGVPVSMAYCFGCLLVSCALLGRRTIHIGHEYMGKREKAR